MSIPSSLLLTGGIAAGICFAVLWILLRTGWAYGIAVDIPNHRSLHAQPIPRVGGWGVLPAALIPIAIEAPVLRWIALGALLLGVLSQIDDRRGLSARTRFIAHAVVVGAAVAISVVRIDGWLAVMAVVALVWIVNLYNFMDGSNGLAGGMTVLGFATYAIAAAPAQPQLAIAGAAVAGAGLGFLILNFHPARIFLGDSGSIPLGFLAGAMGFWGWQHGAWPIWFPALAFAPFFADATVTLLRRLARGEKVWEAHREHYYQRLVQLGATHVRVALFYYFLMLIGSSIALFAVHLPPIGQWLMVGGWYLALAMVGCLIDWRWRRFRRLQTVLQR